MLLGNQQVFTDFINETNLKLMDMDKIAEVVSTLESEIDRLSSLVESMACALSNYEPTQD